MKLRYYIYALVFCAAILFIPRVALFYLICGFLDFYRSRNFSLDNFRRYFVGSDPLTWLLSPFNFLMDFLSSKNHGIYQLDNLPENCQKEIKSLIGTALNKPEIINQLSVRMQNKKRGMIFYKWYDKNIQTDLIIPEFHQKYKYYLCAFVQALSESAY